jgi:hypothetical protein
MVNRSLPLRRRIGQDDHVTTPIRAQQAGARRTSVLGHWHRFRWVGEDAFSTASLYACRCGVVRPGL